MLYMYITHALFFLLLSLCEIPLPIGARVNKAIEMEEAKQIGGRKKVDVENENEQVLKKIISSHPLYQVLIESHINCLKVGFGEAAEFDATSDAWKKLINSNSKPIHSPNTSELDHFMEEYCMALRKLKEAIEEVTKETNAFIRDTYVQLSELNDP